MSEWILPAAALFLVGLAFGARPSGDAAVRSRASDATGAEQNRDRRDPAG